MSRVASCDSLLPTPATVLGYSKKTQCDPNNGVCISDSPFFMFKCLIFQKKIDMTRTESSRARSNSLRLNLPQPIIISRRV